MIEDEDPAEMERQRKALLDRFRNALKESDRDARPWFDEDDLLDVFDFAGDDGDEYLRMEALMWGAHYFPDSVKLRERRGVFYSDIVPEAVSQFTEDNEDKESMLTELIALRDKVKSTGKARRAILDLLGRYNQIEDEEAIQLVRYADDTGNLKWLEGEADNFKDRIQYLPSLLYEIAMTAYDSHDHPMALRVLKKLVEISPYNAEFWSLTADVNFECGNEADGNDALDMTLAIDPENKPALRTRAERLVDATTPDADSVLMDMVRKYPDDEYIVLYGLERRFNKLEDGAPLPPALGRELMAAARQFPMCPQILELLMMYAPDKSRASVEVYYDKMAVVSNDDEWLKWAMSLELDGWHEAALVAVKVLIDKSDKDEKQQSHVIEMKALLYLRIYDWQNCIATIKTYQRMFGETTPALLLAHLTALVRLHRFSEAKRLAEAIVGNDIPPFSIGMTPFEETVKLSTLGLHLLVDAFLKTLSPAGIPDNPDGFDPLMIFEQKL